MNTARGRERWRRLSALFDEAVNLPPAARRAYLDRSCADDASLRADVERMLVADVDDAAIDFGAAALVDRLDLSTPTPDPNEDPADVGSTVGHWCLERVLGRGGMGTVYAARHVDDDSGQRAALKRLHRRWDGSGQAQRFAQERRILAALSHPNLPRLIDHGVDGEGRPWFALEFVDGVNLLERADAQMLGLRARIDLFRRVCAAVQHAHEHFVVHRDLKPANILIDAEGHPKVLDFGVAKRMDDVHGATMTGAFAGFTPEYAAPEQISGGAISAATDVYALGVILYQLLCGCLPYSVEHGDLRATADAIATRTADRLEHAITVGSADELAMRLQQRDTDLRAFRHFVRGDLSRIVQTALAKEPERRYASVLAFTEDLERFLSGRPVSVSGDTFVYRTGKLLRRNRVATAASVLLVLCLPPASAVCCGRPRRPGARRRRRSR